jgi:hypothetical protein
LDLLGVSSDASGLRDLLLNNVLQLSGRITCHQVVETSLDLAEDSVDLALNSLLDHVLNASREQAGEHVQEHVVLGLSDVNLQLVNVDVDTCDLEARSRAAVVQVQHDAQSDALALDQDISGTLVLHLGEGLSVEPKVDAAHLGLDFSDLQQGASTSVFGFHFRHVEFEVASGVDFDHFGHNIVARERQTNNAIRTKPPATINIEHLLLDSVIVVFVGTLDSGDWDLIQLSDEQRHDELTHLRDQIGVEVTVSLGIDISKVFQESLGLFLNVLDVLVLLNVLADSTNLAEDTVELVSPALVFEQFAARIDQIFNALSVRVLVQ